jgi:hypothetical protein
MAAVAMEFTRVVGRALAAAGVRALLAEAPLVVAALPAQVPVLAAVPAQVGVPLAVVLLAAVATAIANVRFAGRAMGPPAAPAALLLRARTRPAAVVAT